MRGTPPPPQKKRSLFPFFSPRLLPQCSLLTHTFCLYCFPLCSFHPFNFFYLYLFSSSSFRIFPLYLLPLFVNWHFLNPIVLYVVMGCSFCRNGREAARQRVERPRAGPPGNNWPHCAWTQANHDRGGRSLNPRPMPLIPRQLPEANDVIEKKKNFW